MWRSLILTCCLALGVSTARAETLVIAGDIWCPINCEQGTELPGVFVELAQQIFGEADIQVEYRVVNWARALVQARQGQIGAVIGATIQDAPDLIFPQTPVVMSRLCFYGLEQQPWRYTGVESLKQIRLGAINGYSYGSELDLYLNRASSQQVQRVTGERALHINVRKLQRKRIDALMENTWVMNWARQTYVPPLELANLGCRQGDVALHMGFSPVVLQSTRYVHIFNAGLERYRRNGRLNAILARYGISVGH